MNDQTNVQKLTAAGIINEGYDANLSDAEVEAINNLSAEDVDAIIRAHESVGDIVKEHAPHGMVY